MSDEAKPTPAEKRHAANVDALRYMHRARRRRGVAWLASRADASSFAQTEGQEDTRFTNPAGHTAEKPGGPHQTGLPFSQEGLHGGAEGGADVAKGALGASEPRAAAGVAESLKSAFGVNKE
jgi:hypothetical protein